MYIDFDDTLLEKTLLIFGIYFLTDYFLALAFNKPYLISVLSPDNKQICQDKVKNKLT